VLLAEGRPQRYGTQLRHELGGGEPQPASVEDPDHVDERRARMGLEPLAAYLEGYRRILQDQTRGPDQATDDR
jgi:hypothetical protein